MRFDEMGEIHDPDADRVAYAKVRERVPFAETVDRRGAHA